MRKAYRMPEVIVKYKNSKTLEALMDLSKYFDFVVQKPKSKKTAAKQKTNLPITFSENPDNSALAGIWKDKDISPKELRKKAWGNRL